MFFMEYPPDPDCKECLGSGSVHKADGISLMLSYCKCRKYENTAKIQQRCKHDYACRKCGKGLDQPI